MVLFMSEGAYEPPTWTTAKHRHQPTTAVTVATILSTLVALLPVAGSGPRGAGRAEVC